MEWGALAERAEERHRDGLARLPGEADARQRQLTRVANAAWAAGLSLLMEGRRDEAGTWLRESAARYRESFADAPLGSWGRLIATLKSRLLAGDWEAAVEDAEWALAQGPAAAESPIGRYAAALALLVLGDDREAGRLVESLRLEAEHRFPPSVGDALAALATRNRGLYAEALKRILESFEARSPGEFLEDVPVADTAAVLEVLARQRGLSVGPASSLLPA